MIPDGTQPMQLFVNLDSVEVRCPCGDSAMGEGEPISRFFRCHKPHTNGKCVESTTADGARAYASPPPPETFDL